MAEARTWIPCEPWRDRMTNVRPSVAEPTTQPSWNPRPVGCGAGASSRRLPCPWITILALALAFVWIAAPVRAAFPGHNGRIAFYSHRDHRYGLFTMRPNGGSVRYIGDGFQPAWSPDAGLIAFVAGDPAVSHFLQIFTMAPNGEDRSRLTLMRGVNAQTPAWSPDGSQIVFAADHIYVMDADGSDLHQVTHRPTDGGEPAWSPDGTRIALDRVGRIVTVDINGHDLRPVTPKSMQAYEPAWSPDGNRIAFTTGESLFTIHPDGSGLRMLAQASGHNGSISSPSWSPDGDWIVYVLTRHFYEANDTQSNFIFKIHPDATYRQQLSDDPHTLDGDPDWGSQQPGSLGRPTTRSIYTDSLARQT